MASLTDFTKKALGGINQKVSGVQNAAAAQQQLAAARAALMDSVSGGQPASAQGVAGKTGSELTNVERYDFWNNATQDQRDEFVKTGKIPASYVPKTNYTFWNAGKATIGDYGIDDSNSATWQQIAALYNSGDVDGAMELVNGLSGQGKFGGYYDDNGNYWGFAQGYMGGANASYQPVLGGKLMTTGLDTTGTNIWLTPDGKALSMGQGGVLTDNGDTWSRTGGGDIGRTLAQQRDDVAASTAAYMEENGGRFPWAQDPVSNGNGGLTYTGNSGGTPYQAALAQADASPGYPSGAAGNYTPSQPMSYEQWSTQNGGKALSSPSAYDPNSDTLWQQYLKQYGDAKAPEWAGGDFDYTQNAAYQQYLKDWANKQAPEYAGDPYQAQRDAALAAYGEKWGGSDYQKQRDAALQKAQNMEWNYNPDTDPVWQAYQKQYRREGQRATEDTLGRVAGMTGGMPSSYAVTAASQAGNYYASQLSDKLPQLYQDAYNRYLQEYQRQLGISDAYAGFDNTEYQRWLQGQQQNLDLANAYNQYGQLDYQKYLDQLGQFNTDRNFNYGAAMDAINQGRSDYNTRYQQYLDQLGQFNTDRNFAYGAARDNQQLGRQANQDEYQRYLDALSQANYEDETAYSRYRDTISDQRYDQEWAQKLREYADSQNWKATEWQQYLREYGDKLSQQEREWAMQQAQYADDKALAMAKLGAQYGDYSGLSGMGIDTSTANPKEVAYAPDGSTYKFNTQDALYFVQNAPNGTPGNPTTMKGSDGSVWKKDEYGNVTITTTNGKVFTYSNNGGGSEQDALSALSAAGITSEGQAYSWLLANGYSATAANKLAKYYAEGLGGVYSGGSAGSGGGGGKSSGSGSGSGSKTGSTNTDDIYATLDSMGYTTVSQVSFALKQMGVPQDMAMAIAKEYVAGLNGGEDGGQAAEENQGAGYNNFVETLDGMVRRGASRNELFSEIDAEVKDGRITKEQGEALKNKYYGAADNVPNSNQTHSGGRPQSAGFNAAYQEAETYNDRGYQSKALQAIRDAYNAGKIHEYEIDIIMDRLGL